LPSFRQRLHKLNLFLQSTTSITLRPKPKIEILYLNGKKGNITTKQEAIPIQINAHIIDHDNENRKVIQHGTSVAITHKAGWLNQVARNIKGELFVETRLLLLENNEYGILLTTPKLEEKA